VVLRGVGEDDDIVEVNKAHLQDHSGQDTVQGTLEGRGGICEAEGHLQVLVRTHVAGENGLVDVFRGHGYLPIPGIAVER